MRCIVMAYSLNGDSLTVEFDYKDECRFDYKGECRFDYKRGL